MKRLIPKQLIPITLWNEQDSVMYLPQRLIASWETLLDSYDLREKAVTIAPKGFAGGRGEEDTKNHFAWRFTGSCARVILTMLDFNEDLGEISDAFAQAFSGNKVFLADLPCGSGAATVSILSILAELRRQNLVPRMPLEITIVGGELSQHAINIAKEMVGSLIEELEAQAITIEFEALEWDVCDRISNTDLIKQITLKAQNCAAKLLILANFSDFLEKESKWQDAKEQFDELFRYSRDKNSIALWIEPRKNNVVKGFIPRVRKWFEKVFDFISPPASEIDKAHAESSVKVKHPLKETTFRNNLAVMRFDLPKGTKNLQ